MKITKLEKIDNTTHLVKSVKKLNKPVNENGIECVFILLTKAKGLKLFDEREEAVRTCRRQRIAYNHNLAPDVCTSVETYLTPFKRSKKAYFGYVTEVAQTMEYKEFNTLLDTEEYKTFERELKTIKMDGDLHSANVGRVRGKLVCIDFGDSSAS